MSLEPYTNTYSDTDGSIADADDIVAEFDRVATFINAWSDSFESIGLTTVEDTVIDEVGVADADIYPTSGLIQMIQIGAEVTTININIKDRAEGDPYRVYLSVRFFHANTYFTVSAPAGSSHIFGLNRTQYQTSFKPVNGMDRAMIIITYASNGVHLQVYPTNLAARGLDGDVDAATDVVELDDLLQEVSV